MFDAAIAEVAQERIARAQRQKRERRAFFLQYISLRCVGEKSVHNFIRSSIAADRDEMPHAALIRFARNLCSIAGSARSRDLHLDASGTESIERRAEQLLAAPAARCRIHDCKVGLQRDFSWI
jgi:hypothetical protein